MLASKPIAPPVNQFNPVAGSTNSFLTILLRMPRPQSERPTNGTQHVSSPLVGKGLNHSNQHGLRLGPHFIVRRILDRVFDQQIACVLHAQRVALGLSGFAKLAGGDGNCRKTLDLEPHSVVHTARCA